MLNRLVRLGWFATLILALGLCTAAAAQTPMVKRGYTDMVYGQLHYVMATPSLPKAKWKTTLVLLHQSPNTSTEYGPFIAAMGRDRIVIAIDTPGYGGSDGPTKIPHIEDYAAAITEGLHNLGYGHGRQVDIFGYHTGNFIATEIALHDPSLVRRLVYSGVYIVPPERLEEVRKNVVNPPSALDAVNNFCSSWPRTRTYYEASKLPNDAWVKIRIEGIRSLEGIEYGHDAAFEYAAKARERLPLLTEPVLLLILDDGISQPTLDSQPFFKHAQLKDLRPLAGDVFYNHSEELAAVVRSFLDAA